MKKRTIDEIRCYMLNRHVASFGPMELETLLPHCDEFAINGIVHYSDLKKPTRGFMTIKEDGPNLQEATKSKVENPESAVIKGVEQTAMALLSLIEAHTDAPIVLDCFCNFQCTPYYGDTIAIETLFSTKNNNQGKKIYTFSFSVNKIGAEETIAEGKIALS